MSNGPIKNGWKYASLKSKHSDRERKFGRVFGVRSPSTVSNVCETNEVDLPEELPELEHDDGLTFEEPDDDQCNIDEEEHLFFSPRGFDSP